MPQMMPLSWFSLYIFTIMILLFMLIMIYFNFIFKLKIKKMNFLKKKKL